MVIKFKSYGRFRTDFVFVNHLSPFGLFSLSKFHANSENLRKYITEEILTPA